MAVRSSGGWPPAGVGSCPLHTTVRVNQLEGTRHYKLVVALERFIPGYHFAVDVRRPRHRRTPRVLLRWQRGAPGGAQRVDRLNLAAAALICSLDIPRPLDTPALEGCPVSFTPHSSPFFSPGCRLASGSACDGRSCLPGRIPDCRIVGSAAATPSA